MKNPINVAVVGATGMVGQEFFRILEEGDLPVGELRPFASEKSKGKTVNLKGKDWTIQTLEEGCFKGCDVAFFSAGGSISKKWAPIAASEGAMVIDNSSAFRMNPETPLVVPEVNPHQVPPLSEPTIIANPNCSTIQLVVALKPLAKNFGLKSVTVATYQSVSGAGIEAVEALKNQTRNFLDGKQDSQSTFVHNMAFNNLPHIDVFEDNGYTKEEMKVVNETKKILELPELEVSCTAVRTSTINGHSEAVWVELKQEPTKEEFCRALADFPGLVVQDDPSSNTYPLTTQASGLDPVFVGRIRQDLNNPKRWLLWVVSDNIRKGAALNGVQIAQQLLQRTSN